MKVSLARSQSLNSTSNLRSLYNIDGSASGSDIGGSGGMKSAIKLLGVGVLCFVGGMQVDRGSIVQINFSSHIPHAAGIDTANDATTAFAATNNSGANEIAATADFVTKASDKPVERIILLGERHSGTNWITDYLEECFGDRVIVSGKTAVVVFVLSCKHNIQNTF
jgi:hypothetical protein